MSAASDVLHRLEEDLESMEQRKKPGEVVRVFYGGAFGVLAAFDMQPASHDSLRIVARDREGRTHVIIAPVSQSSFMLSAVAPVAGEPEQKVILGFAQPNPI